MKFCPACGKALASESSNFCDGCGMKVEPSAPNLQQKSDAPVNEEKNPILAVICSFFIPGLGQVYDGHTARGIAFFFGTLIGFFLLVIPAIIIWLYGMYDAYTLADKMNKKEIPFMPTKTAHLILFIILVFFIVALVVFILAMMVLGAMESSFSHSFPVQPTMSPFQ